MTTPLLYSLTEIAELTGWSLRALKRDTRAGRIDHVRRGRAIAMTPEQVAQLIDAHTVTSATLDPLAAVRARVARRSGTT